MKQKDKIKADLARLRKSPTFQPEIGRVADSLERLLDGATKGGEKRAKNLTKKRRKEIASNAAKARWSKTGARAK